MEKGIRAGVVVESLALASVVAAEVEAVGIIPVVELQSIASAAQKNPIRVMPTMNSLDHWVTQSNHIEFQQVATMSSPSWRAQGS